MSRLRLAHELADGWTIKLGLYSIGVLKKTFEIYRYHVSDRSHKMMEQKGFIPFSSREEIVRVVVRSVGELGFEDGTEYQYLCLEAVLQGYRLCPPEVGPRVRKLYVNQPTGELLRIAMHPITMSADEQYIFAMDRHRDDNRLRLGADLAFSDDYYGPNSLFAFVLPRKLFLPFSA